MSRWADWISESTEPEGHEIARVVQALDPELLDVVKDVTLPTDAELNRLLVSRAKAVVSRSSIWDWEPWGGRAAPGGRVPAPGHPSAGRRGGGQGHRVRRDPRRWAGLGRLHARRGRRALRRR